jgi:hypothetical protein
MSSAIPQGERQEEDIGEAAEDSRRGRIHLTSFEMVGIKMVFSFGVFQEL